MPVSTRFCEIRRKSGSSMDLTALPLIATTAQMASVTTNAKA